MALIDCSECGKSISDKASACPSCGCPVEVVKPTSLVDDCEPAIPASGCDSTDTEPEYITHSYDDGFTVLKGLLVFVGGIVILAAVFFPPVGISAISIYGIGRLIMYFGKD
jgi:hypothetical protein